MKCPVCGWAIADCEPVCDDLRDFPSAPEKMRETRTQIDEMHYEKIMKQAMKEGAFSK